MDDIDRQVPYPRFLKVPYIFWPDGTPEAPEWAQFKADYPGWVQFRATFAPTPHPVQTPEPQPEVAVSEQTLAEPGPLEQTSPDARPRPGHLRQIPPPSMTISPRVPPPRRPFWRKGEGSDPLRLGDMDQRDLARLQGSGGLGGASNVVGAGKDSRLAQAVEGEMPVEPPIKPAEGEEANPGPGGLSDMVAPETQSAPAATPQSEVAPVPQPTSPAEPAPSEVRARGDVKGGLPTPAAKVSPGRQVHILDGDRTGGGHRAGTGRPNKSEVPASWSDAKIMSAIESIANDLSSKRSPPDPSGRVAVDGTRESIEIRVIVEGKNIVSVHAINVQRDPKGK